MTCGYPGGIRARSGLKPAASFHASLMDYAAALTCSRFSFASSASREQGRFVNVSWGLS